VPSSTTIVRPDVETGVETKLVPRWKVLLLNDDVTTFAFVIELLKTLFRKPHPEAVRLTHEIHNTGSATITVTSQERAELYVEQVRSLARPRGFPLTAAIEPV
jgi:ATP-dependent Clp protease adaptor protein ClpS